MGIKEILIGLIGARPGKNSLWDFLGQRATAKSRVELEKVRNVGTLALVPLMMPGMVLREGGSGWMREIRMPGRLAAPDLTDESSYIDIPAELPTLGDHTPYELTVPDPAAQQALEAGDLT